ncbi:DUF4886 domain-containing protein [Puniceicoccus vermicola]|uniref:DUF4886 domain-containing protein n=1 Tax=Puniceicoccus vermicola TaxID=388746 RepID=A0A7X1AXG6_9BACT|nr:DUF4886 domain-containing protein [Puniceicoccus vermicola]MBC2601823.1 DUF4886 domain-containing protein [Puniceicoccus vermicola]
MKTRILMIQWLSLSCLALVATFASAEEDGALYILGIGNSFTENATRFLPEIAASDPEHDVVVGRAIIGASPLSLHVALARQHAENQEKGNNYGYDINNERIEKKASLEHILKDKKWDYVTIQQVSSKSHKAETFSPHAEKLIGYIHEYAPQAQIVVHETWPHNVDSYRTKKWNLQPDEMYERLHENYYNLAAEQGLRVIPVGTAFQEAQKMPLWDYEPVDFDVYSLPYPEGKSRMPDESKSLNKIFYWRKNSEGDWVIGTDGFHANKNGEYLGSLVWYGFFFRKDPREIEYQPRTLTDEQADSLREAAYITLRDAAGVWEPPELGEF